MGLKRKHSRDMPATSKGWPRERLQNPTELSVAEVANNMTLGVHEHHTEALQEVDPKELTSEGLWELEQEAQLEKRREKWKL